MFVFVGSSGASGTLETPFTHPIREGESINLPGKFAWFPPKCTFWNRLKLIAKGGDIHRRPRNVNFRALRSVRCSRLRKGWQGATLDVFYLYDLLNSL